MMKMNNQVQREASNRSGLEPFFRFKIKRSDICLQTEQKFISVQEKAETDM